MGHEASDERGAVTARTSPGASSQTLHTFKAAVSKLVGRRRITDLREGRLMQEAAEAPPGGW